MNTAARDVVRRRRAAIIEVACDVDVSPSVAAETLRDTRTWPLWSPVIEGVESDDRYVRQGTRGRVRIGCGWVPFRVTGFNGRRWDWIVAGLPATGHSIEAYVGEPNRCRVIIEVPLPAIAYVPTCERALRRFADGLERDAF
ncbi:polyketide cyclase [Halorubrum vacuolatum]|uniref:Polyketide cyclase / dehydrase and lipid transport n=1 Tax=Halorubrum vacuolatum TaxID=63740 RepID=A0A238VD60_HALVU|nr:polyketide cyclase [Halorubrum vacuolatum]SNR31977.1 hypothetical protein SAMN06264855_102252 [Halorubrum vacuolatum]